MIALIDTLADQRGVYKLLFPEASTRLFPGQYLVQDKRVYPVMKIETHALWLVSAELPTSLAFDIRGEAVTPQLDSTKTTALLSVNDGVFSLIAWLFHYRHLFNPAKLRAFCASDRPLAFRPQPSPYLTPELPPYVTASIPLLDDWRIVSRLFHPAGLPGCHDDEVSWQQAIAAYPQQRRFNDIFTASVNGI